MRIRATVFAASAISVCAFTSVWSQALIPQRTTPPPAPAAAPAPAPAPAAAAPPAPAPAPTAAK
ncbi:MAG: polysaccharide deacetylase family protein, partial [Afipia sp.]